MNSLLTGRMQAAHLSSSVHLRGQALRAAVPMRTVSTSAAQLQVVSQQFEERFRLDNVGPQPGARRRKQRVGRGYGAGQGGTCGDGMRGQKARSGGGIRPGFEGGQMPLYRRLPKLRGIAGGMSAGVPKYVVVNLDDLNARFKDGEEVNTMTIQEKGLCKLTGRESRLPLKVLGDGELKVKVKVSATAFSETAKEKITAAGGTINELPPKVKWTKAIGKERAAAKKEGDSKKGGKKGGKK